MPDQRLTLQNPPAEEPTLTSDGDPARPTYAQLPLSVLSVGRWYVGRGRNGNVGMWDGKRFLVLDDRRENGETRIKREPYYEDERGFFQPFALIDEGAMVKPFGTTGWDAHYGTVMTFPGDIARGIVFQPEHAAADIFQTGIAALDHGLNAPRNALILAGGQTGIGLTATLARIALRPLHEQHTVIWAGNTGTEREALAQRLLAAESGLLLSQVQNPPDDESVRDLLAGARSRLENLALDWLPGAHIDIPLIEQHAAAAATRGRPAGLIVIDLPGKTAPGVAPTDMWQNLKALAERVGAPVIVAVRMHDRRKFARQFRPRDFDLAPPALQIADVVMGVTRPSWFEKDARDDLRNLGIFPVHVVVARNRHGKVYSAMFILGDESPKA